MEDDKNSDHITTKKLTDSHEIISEILSCLPVRTVARFKSVSKAWQSLIDSPKFSLLHAQKSLKSHSNLLLVLSTGCHLLCTLVDELDDSGITHDSKQHISFSNPTPLGHQVVGSCNGLICTVLFEHAIYVINPLTGSLRHLPILDSNGSCSSTFDDDDHWVSFGFGQDFVSEDYKLVRIHQVNSRGQTEVHVLSLKSKTWKRVGKFPGCIEEPRVHGKFANGALHWLVSRSKEIVAFDLNTEKYSYIDLPDYQDKRIPAVSFGVLGERLYFQVDYIKNYRQWVVVWLMDHGVRSWCKLFEFEYEKLLLSTSNIITRIRPLGFAKGEGQVLLLEDIRKSEGSLLVRYGWYDLNDGSTKYLRNPKIPGKYESENYTTELVCVGSLVCPYRATW